MKLLINTASTFKGGSVQLAKSFIEECKKHKEHTYHVILGAALAKIIETDPFPDNFYFYKINYRPAERVFSLKPRTAFFKKIEKRVELDIVFTTSGPAYWRPEAPHVVGYNLAHYLYPESPFWGTLSIPKQVKWKLKGLIIRYFFTRDADAYVVQTDDVNQRLRKFLERNRVYTVSNTCSAYYYNPKSFPNKLPKKRKNEFRLLTISAWYPHKHLNVIPVVIDSLPEGIKQRVRFVLTLPKEVFEKHFPIKYRSHIENVGPVSIEEGPGLYRECDALFLPTLLECFSVSYAEAMAMEKPILTSDMGFARSICQDAALYFDSMRPKDIADKITELAGSKKIREGLAGKGKNRLLSFGTAQNRAEQYLKICKEISNSK